MNCVMTSWYINKSRVVWKQQHTEFIMAQLNPKTPPVLSNPEGYSNWRANLEMFTDLEKKKRGPAVFLSLTGQAREYVKALGAEEIGKETGVKSIIEGLDKIFLKDSEHEYILLLRNFIITDKCQV